MVCSGSVFGSRFVIQYFMSVESYNPLDGKERAGQQVDMFNCFPNV